jgi:hypothetical protein
MPRRPAANSKYIVLPRKISKKILLGNAYVRIYTKKAATRLPIKMEIAVSNASVNVDKVLSTHSAM